MPHFEGENRILSTKTGLVLYDYFNVSIGCLGPTRVDDARPGSTRRPSAASARFIFL
jgi:hypothetical protein